MKDALAGGGTIVLLEQDAVWRKRLVHRLGDFLHRRHHCRQAINRQIQDVLRAFLGHHQYMTVGFRHYVHEGQGLGVFQDFRQTAVQGQNFGIVQTTGFTGSFSYVLTPFITTNAFATYTTNETTGIGNNSSAPSSNTLTTGAGLNWQLLRWLAMRLQYTYTQYGTGSNSSNGTSSFNGTNGTRNTSVNQASVGFFTSF